MAAATLKSLQHFSSLATILFLLTTQTHAASCTVTSNTLSFGNYNVFANAPLNSTGTIEVKCTPDSTSYTITLDNGFYGSILNRKMRSSNSNEVLSYNLYTNTTFITLWGDGAGGGIPVVGLHSDTFTVYGRILPLQDVSIGSYADSVT